MQDNFVHILWKSFHRSESFTWCLRRTINLQSAMCVARKSLRGTQPKKLNATILIRHLKEFEEFMKLDANTKAESKLSCSAAVKCPLLSCRWQRHCSGINHTARTARKLKKWLLLLKYWSLSALTISRWPLWRTRVSNDLLPISILATLCQDVSI